MALWFDAAAAVAVVIGTADYASLAHLVVAVAFS
jgi:hypothetical protein